MSSTTLSGRRLIVVDDDASICHVLSLLFRHEDFEVVGEALNGQEALALAREYQPDFIILDYLMPAIDGAATANALRLLSPSSRIVALSAALHRKPSWADAFLNKEHIIEITPLLESLVADRA